MHVLSTAGHVDHGKSTLIRRLTGIDPDRLREEKERGLTIDLGFAWLTLPGGLEAGIVDVPGHERFIHNMLAGVGSVDATLFVVAANEGWRPQSEEHLAILDLLGARGGVVALTKADTVSASEIPGIAAQVSGRLAGTSLAGAPVVPVSATTGDGLDDLTAALVSLLESTPAAADRGRARLFVDRSFSIKGAGTVVTGTLTGGALAVEDEVVILPAGRRARVRGIQTHKQKRDRAVPGSRVAVNVAGLDREQVARGDALVHPDRWRPSALIDVRMRTVRGLDHAVTGRGAFKLYIGAAEVEARLRLLDVREVAPGGEAFARLALGAPVVAEPFDRFVLRDSGRRATVAGGVVLDPHPARLRLRADERPGRVRELRTRLETGREGAATATLEERGAIAKADLPSLCGASEPPAGSVTLRSFVLSPDRARQHLDALSRALTAFHEREPLAAGMPRDDARIAAGIEDAKMFAELVEAAPGIEPDGPLLRAAGHAVRLTPEQQRARDAVCAMLDAAGLAPPPLDDVRRAHGAKLVRALLDAGDLVEIAPGMALTRERLAEAKGAIAAAIGENGPMTTSELRQVLGTSRKYAIPLLERLDATGFTKRSGDTRALA